MTFGSNLKSLRARRGVTQEQLAAMMGVSRQAVAKWEADKSYPEVEKIVSICDAFDCSMDELVRGDIAYSEREATTGRDRQGSGGGCADGTGPAGEAPRDMARSEAPDAASSAESARPSSRRHLWAPMLVGSAFVSFIWYWAAYAIGNRQWTDLSDPLNLFWLPMVFAGVTYVLFVSNDANDD